MPSCGAVPENRQAGTGKQHGPAGTGVNGQVSQEYRAWAGYEQVKGPQGDGAQAAGTAPIPFRPILTRTGGMDYSLAREEARRIDGCPWPRQRQPGAGSAELGISKTTPVAADESWESG